MGTSILIIIDISTTNIRQLATYHFFQAVEMGDEWVLGLNLTQRQPHKLDWFSHWVTIVQAFIGIMMCCVSTISLAY